MKLAIINIESLGAVSSIDLDTVFSVEPCFDEEEGSVQLIVWSRYKFAGDDSSDFFIIDEDIDEDSKVTYEEASETTMKAFNLLMDFWSDDSKKVCFITDATLRGYTPKMRLNPFE